MKCFSSIFLFRFLLFRVSSFTYHLESLSSLPLKKKIRKEMEGQGCFGSFFQRCKPYIAMISLQFGYAGMNIITKVSLNRGMSHYVLVVYRHAFATAAIAPFALILER